MPKFNFVHLALQLNMYAHTSHASSRRGYHLQCGMAWCRRKLLLPLTATVAFLAIYCLLKILLGPGRKVASGHSPAAKGEASHHAFELQRTNQEAPKTRRLGYLLALRYYEQQTQATKNFLQMQCLANSYNMQVVEPFLSDSQFSFPFSLLAQPRTGEERVLRLGDIIDMVLWNQQTVGRYGYPRVASWEQFLKNAPRDVVLVCVRCRDPPHIKVPKPGANFRLDCSDACFDKFRDALRFLRTHGFRFVRKACANFVAYAGSVTSDDFLDNILEKRYQSEDITVILSEFRGFFGLYRMQILSPCGLITHADMKVNMKVMPSQLLVEEAGKYVEMNFDSQPYIAILVRVEKIVLHSLLNISKCASETVSKLEELKGRFGVKEHFLAMDVGQFGSSGSAVYNLQPQGEHFFRQVYGDQWTFHQWEQSFVASASSSNPAYVANLQRTLAAMGRCLLMVGAGGFQAQARNLYEKYHPNTSSRCVYKICAG